MRSPTFIEIHRDLTILEIQGHLQHLWRYNDISNIHWDTKKSRTIIEIQRNL